MGCNGSRESETSNSLNESDYKFLTSHTGLSREEIKEMSEKFDSNNPDRKLNKKEFARLYGLLRPESPELIDKISDYVFKCFDTNNNGSIDFNEFLIGFALTSTGDPRTKLEYAFEIYDTDNQGFIDEKEVSTFLTQMLDFIGKF